MADEKRPFAAHLEDLRKRIIYSLISLIALSVLSYNFAGKILENIARDVPVLVFIAPEEAFLSYLKIALFSGLILSSPIILYNVFKFTWVALEKPERKALLLFTVAAVFLVICGAIFAYVAVLPIATNFLLGFATGFLKPYISVSRYISFGIFLILAFCVAFEMPLFILFLTRLGIVNSDLLKKKRKYFVILIFITAAFLTPPDAITQIFLAIPLVILYEISLWLSTIVERHPKSERK